LTRASHRPSGVFSSELMRELGLTRTSIVFISRAGWCTCRWRPRRGKRARFLDNGGESRAERETRLEILPESPDCAAGEAIFVYGHRGAGIAPGAVRERGNNRGNTTR
jgi:hypothetical protein